MNAMPDSFTGIERRALDSLASAVLLLDPQLAVRYANPAAEMLLAISSRQIIGQPIAGLLRSEEDVLIRHVQRACELGRSLTEREVTLLQPEGQRVTVDCTTVPLSALDGVPGLLLEMQQVDQHLRFTREEQLLSQQEATRDVVRGLAHEIKNPLGGLRGAAQLLEAELEDRELKEYTRVIIEEADRLQTLVNRMLGPNRMPAYARVSIHQVLERVYTLVKAEVADRVTLQRDYDPSIPDLVGDMDQLIQAVLNIVRNAARAVGDGGTVVLRTRVQRQFTIGNTRHRLVLQLEIIDNGPGIPDEIREKIFYPMVTSGTGGMGLGLSIAQSIINQHKGLIECRSRPGNTVFTVFLPVETNND
jgi:two-component system nitrogen regulation sensor histidine kinase GlnL